VQRDQGRARVNAQLIDADTGAHLWAERFEEDVGDLFKLQDQIVAKLANALRYELESAEADKGAASPNPDAIDLVMRGQTVLRSASLGIAQTESTHAARALFERALQIDPNNSLALAANAATYWREYAQGPRDPSQDYDSKIIGQADKAIAADRSDISAYEVKSGYLAISGRPAAGLQVADGSGD